MYVYNRDVAAAVRIAWILTKVVEDHSRCYTLKILATDDT